MNLFCSYKYVWRKLSKLNGRFYWQIYVLEDLFLRNEPKAVFCVINFKGLIVDLRLVFQHVLPRILIKFQILITQLIIFFDGTVWVVKHRLWICLRFGIPKEVNQLSKLFFNSFELLIRVPESVLVIGTWWLLRLVELVAWGTFVDDLRDSLFDHCAFKVGFLEDEGEDVSQFFLWIFQ